MQGTSELTPPPRRASSGMAPGTKGTPVYCAEGFEEAVGTNHLGHFLLANLLIKVKRLPRQVSHSVSQSVGLSVSRRFHSIP